MSPYILLADLVLVLHAAFAAYIVLGLAAIWAGYFLGWTFVRNRAFRLTHLAAIAIVVAETVLGIFCPLTELEQLLRTAGGGEGYGGEGFIAYWLGRLLYWEFEPWIFGLAYFICFGLVLLAWKVVVPERRAIS